MLSGRPSLPSQEKTRRPKNVFCSFQLTVTFSELWVWRFLHKETIFGQLAKKKKKLIWLKNSITNVSLPRMSLTLLLIRPFWKQRLVKSSKPLGNTFRNDGNVPQDVKITCFQNLSRQKQKSRFSDPDGSILHGSLPRHLPVVQLVTTVFPIQLPWQLKVKLFTFLFGRQATATSKHHQSCTRMFHQSRYQLLLATHNVQAFWQQVWGLFPPHSLTHDYHNTQRGFESNLFFWRKHRENTLPVAVTLVWCQKSFFLSGCSISVPCQSLSHFFFVQPEVLLSRAHLKPESLVW